MIETVVELMGKNLAYCTYVHSYIQIFVVNESNGGQVEIHKILAGSLMLCGDTTLAVSF